MHRKKISIWYTLAGPRVGIKEVDDAIWLVSFMHYDLGYIAIVTKSRTHCARTLTLSFFDWSRAQVIVCSLRQRYERRPHEPVDRDR